MLLEFKYGFWLEKFLKASCCSAVKSPKEKLEELGWGEEVFRGVEAATLKFLVFKSLIIR